MTYRQLQKACKEAGLPARGKTDVLRKNLEDYLKDPAEALSRLGKVVKEKDAWVKWKEHPAREIFNIDIEQGGWLYGKDDEDARDVYEIYKEREPEAFKDVPFDQFKENFDTTMKKAAKRRARSAEELEFMRHDRILHPRQTHNQRGEPVFDMDEEAKQQLREDIENKVHKGMKPSELHALRPVYQRYELHIFRPRIYQEIRRKKFINYLNKKRTEKRDAYKAKKAASEMKYERKQKKKEQKEQEKQKKEREKQKKRAEKQAARSTQSESNKRSRS